MRRTRLAPIAALGLSLVLAGCPEDAPPPPDAGVDAGVSISPVEMCDRMAAARCGLISRCYAAFDRQGEQECHLLEQSRCLAEYTRLKPSFESGAVSLDVEKILECEDRMASSTCAPSFPPGYGATAAPYSDCQLHTGLLLGALPSGSTCSEAVECVPGTACVKPGGVCKGTCSTLGKAGEPCGFGCAEGLFCDAKGNMDPQDDRCGPLLGVKAACESSAQCQPDLWCDGTCKKRGALGDPCRWDAERISTCLPGFACDVVPFVADLEGTCVKPRGEGEPCFFHWSCLPGLVCYDLILDQFPSAPPMNPGYCLPPAPAGEACPYSPYGAFVGDQCAAGTSCDSGNNCTARPTRGQACDPFTQSCAGLEVYCKPSQSAVDQGTCTGPAGLSERCATKLQDGTTVQIPCESGYCDVQTTLNCLQASKNLGEVCGSDGECLSGRCAVQEDRTLRCAEACL